MLKKISAIIMLGLLLIVGGCSKQVFDVSSSLYRQSSSKKKVYFFKLIEGSYYLGDKLAVQLKNYKQAKQPFLIAYASFFNCSESNSTSKLGLILAEQVSSRLVQHGFKVVERIIQQKKLDRVTNKSKLFWPNYLAKLKRSCPHQKMLIGIYNQIGNKVLVNTKVIDFNNNVTLASADCVFYFSHSQLIELNLIKNE